MSVRNDSQLAEVVVLCDTNGARTRAAAERNAPRELSTSRCIASFPQVVQGHFPDRARGCNLARGRALGVFSPSCAMECPPQSQAVQVVSDLLSKSISTA